MLKSKPLWEPTPVHLLSEWGWGSHQNFRFSQSRISLDHCFGHVFTIARRVFEQEGLS